MFLFECRYGKSGKRVSKLFLNISVSHLRAETGISFRAFKISRVSISLSMHKRLKRNLCLKRKRKKKGDNVYELKCKPFFHVIYVVCFIYLI